MMIPTNNQKEGTPLVLADLVYSEAHDVVIMYLSDDNVVQPVVAKAELITEIAELVALARRTHELEKSASELEKSAESFAEWLEEMKAKCDAIENKYDREHRE